MIKLDGMLVLAVGLRLRERHKYPHGINAVHYFVLCNERRLETKLDHGLHPGQHEDGADADARERNAHGEPAPAHEPVGQK